MNRDQKLLGRERGGQQQRDDGPTVAAMVPVVVWVSTAARQRPAVAQPHREAECAMTKLGELLDRALASGDDAPVRTELVQHSGLPGARLNLRLLSAFAGAVGEVARRPDPPVAALEALLDRWAAMPQRQAPVDRPEVILPCAAVAAYGEVGAVRPDWWDDEVAKLGNAATDGRWRVREVVALARPARPHPSAAGCLSSRCDPAGGPVWHGHRSQRPPTAGSTGVRNELGEPRPSLGLKPAWAFTMKGPRRPRSEEIPAAKVVHAHPAAPSWP
jgi:hypothetical protein